jgi:tRNA (cmo5U34)-methyltransferase
MNEDSSIRSGDMKGTSEIGRVFDEMSNQYTDIMDQMVPHYRKLITSMLELLPANFHPVRVLDLGCGNGNVSTLSMVLFPNAKHHLVDASEDMISACNERFKGRSATYEQCLFQSMELKADTYDLVIAGFSLHHLETNEKKLFFNRLFPAMTKQGIFTCADLFINKEDEEHEMLLKAWQKFVFSKGRSIEDWDWLINHYDAYDRPNKYADQEDWLLNAGFARVELSWSDGHWGCFHAYKQ